MARQSMESLFGDDYKLNGAQDHAVYHCPKSDCTSTEGKGERKLYVNLETGGFKCHKCGYKGYVHTEGVKFEPVAREISSLDDLGCQPVTPGSPGYVYLTEQRDRALSDEEISLYDFYDSDDMSFAGGLVVPARDEGYKGFQVRIYDREASWRWQRMHPDLRWWNCRGFHRVDTIWNYAYVDRTKPVCVTESVFSGIACGRNSVGMFGKDFSRPQIARLYMLKCPLILVLDGGPIEHKLAYDYAEQLWLLGRQVGLVLMPNEYDPDELKDEDPDELERLLSSPLSYSKQEHWRVARLVSKSKLSGIVPTVHL